MKIGENPFSKQIHITAFFDLMPIITARHCNKLRPVAQKGYNSWFWIAVMVSILHLYLMGVDSKLIICQVVILLIQCIALTSTGKFQIYNMTKSRNGITMYT